MAASAEEKYQMCTECNRKVKAGKGLKRNLGRQHVCHLIDGRKKPRSTVAVVNQVLLQGTIPPYTPSLNDKAPNDNGTETEAHHATDATATAQTPEPTFSAPTAAPKQTRKNSGAGYFRQVIDGSSYKFCVRNIPNLSDIRDVWMGQHYDKDTREATK